ncbi:MAG: transglycosylase SLT domain-containing protein [Capsulimonadaceae bacterium]
MSDFLNSGEHLQDTFDRSHPYLPDMVRVLRSYGLPDDLVYLAFAESEFSKRGKGPWQFNSGTAKHFGLHIDRYVDERRDPVMSTKAAAEYLATLHDEAGDDWPMTVVAWNNGDKAITVIGRCAALTLKSSATGCRGEPAGCWDVSWPSRI